MVCTEGIGLLPGGAEVATIGNHTVGYRSTILRFNAHRSATMCPPKVARDVQVAADDTSRLRGRHPPGWTYRRLRKGFSMK